MDEFTLGLTKSIALGRSNSEAKAVRPEKGARGPMTN
jgi:hypothetical protein